MNKRASEITVDALVSQFQRALRCLAPIAEDVGIEWREPENYHDWDLIASGAYSGFVVEAIASSDSWKGGKDIIGYDRRVSAYREFSFLGVSFDGDTRAFICFQTMRSPFDQILLAKLDEKLHVHGYEAVMRDECQLAYFENNGDIIRKEKNLFWSAR